MPEVAARTHVGHVRDGNEDAHVVSETAWVVADGLGGHHGGEVASRLAAQAAHDVLVGSGDAAEAFRAASPPSPVARTATPRWRGWGPRSSSRCSTATP